MLKDSDWYDVNDIKDNTIWGKNKSCDFVTNTCDCTKTPTFDEFCKLRNDSRLPF